jgi:hypothetical protein
MSECAMCHVSVLVPDGHEWEDGDLCYTCLYTELKDTECLCNRLSDLLEKTANALHGEPLENGYWSFHDLPELATKLKERSLCLEFTIRELLKGGEHEGECDNDQGMLNEGGACQKHCDANDAREAAARKLLEATDGRKPESTL